jgi:hypothetical protein
MEALVALPRSVVVLNRSLTNLAETVAVLDLLVRRLDRLTEPLEEPLTALAPRLEALVPLLDEQVIQSLPAVLNSIERNAVPALELMGHTREQLASIAASVERLLSVMEEGFARFQELPGAFLVSRLRGSGRAATTTSPMEEAAPAPAASVRKRADRASGPRTPTTAPPAPAAPGPVTVPGDPTPAFAPGTPTEPPGPASRPRTSRPSRASPPTEEHRSWQA